MRKKHITFLLIISLLTLRAEEKPKVFSANVLAEVNGRIITQNDFVLSYESSLSFLKHGASTKERKKNYLDLMIGELLLADEGYKVGFNSSAMVKKSKRILENELLIEELIEKRIKPRIQITEDDIKNALNKNKVNFKLGFWQAASLGDAVDLRKLLLKSTHINQKETQNKVLINREQETNYLTWLELPDEILKAVQNLSVDDVSNPVQYNGVYFLFKVKDIKREAVTENEYNSKAPSIKKVLIGKEISRLVISYVDSLLTPQNVTVKREEFNLLAQAILEWRKNSLSRTISFNDFLYSSNASDSLSKALLAYKDKPFVITKTKTFSLKEFLEIFEADKILPSIKKNPSYKEIVNNQIALTIRDYFLAKESRELGFHNSETVKHNLNKWEGKWIYEQYKIELQKSAANNDKTVKDISSLLVDEITKKRMGSKIFINESLLDSTSVIESSKNIWLTTQFYKAGTNRPLVPLLDPIWSKTFKNEIN